MNTTLSTALLAALAGGCTVGTDADAPLSYEEFEATYIAKVNGRLIYDWDVPLRSSDDVHKLYAEYMRAKTTGERLSEATVNLTLFGGVDVWSQADAANLTYCVSDTFGANKDRVIDAMAQATAAWTDATGGVVRYVHQAQYDASCNTSTPVVFDVNPGEFAYASAFFPSWPRNERSLLIHPATFNGDFPAAGILRHELGHTLGLRHETARTEGIMEYGVHCFENIFFRGVTAFDEYSVMTTPACMGKQLKNTTLSLSALDVEGIRSLY